MPSDYTRIQKHPAGERELGDDTMYPPPPSRQTRRNRSTPTPQFNHSRSKGKGKARSYADEEDQREGEEEDQGPPGLSFNVRFTDGVTKDVTDLWVGKHENVKEVKRRLRLLRPETLYTSELPVDDNAVDNDTASPTKPPPSSTTTEPKPRRLRLIQLGRMLVDGVFLVPYTVQLMSNRQQLVDRHSSGNNDSKSIGDDLIEPTKEALKSGLEKVGKKVSEVVRKSSDRTTRPGSFGESDTEGDDVDLMERGISGKTNSNIGKGKAKEGAREEEQIWLHCSVGDAIDDEEGSNGVNENGQASEQMTPLQGFDRLREAGFSESEIETMRQEFRETRGAGRFDFDEEDDENGEHQRALEEQWMSGMTGQEEAVSDSAGAGHYVTLLKGVCVGFFIPFIPLFFFRTQIFSKRMQMAIVLGILINIGFGLLRLLG